MENQHRRITGYRDLTPEEIALMNRIKAAGVDLAGLLQEIGAHLDKQLQGAHIKSVHSGRDEQDRIMKAQPNRWLSIAQTDLQKGLMALTRAVAQPGGF